MTPEDMAKLFHRTYESLAPQFDYTTREETRADWEDVPENNKNLMIATCGEVMARLQLLGYLVNPQSDPCDTPNTHPMSNREDPVDVSGMTLKSIGKMRVKIRSVKKMKYSSVGDEFSDDTVICDSCDKQ